MTRLLVLVLLLPALTWAQADPRSSGLPKMKLELQPVTSGSVTSFFGKTPKVRSSLEGWNLTGSRIEAYELRCDDLFGDCEVPILRTRSGVDGPLGMASVTHTEPALTWRGLRVKLTAELRTGRVDGWAGLWMRIDGANERVLAFDNMQDRALRGTSSYQTVSVVLDVPGDAEVLTLGVMLHGPGAVFIRSVTLEEVGRDVPTTDLVAPLKAAQAPAKPSGG